MTEISTKAMIFFVLFVVVLSAVFTWQALDFSFQTASSVDNTDGFEENDNIIKSGIGINIVPKDKGG